MILALLLAAATAQQFDLICTGTDTTSIRGQPPTTRPWTKRMAFDLARSVSRWDGASLNQPVSVTDTSLTFHDGKPSPLGSMREYIDRNTGKFSAEETMSTGVGTAYGRRSVTAQCEVAPYTGVVDNKF